MFERRSEGLLMTQSGRSVARWEWRFLYCFFVTFAKLDFLDGGSEWLRKMSPAS